MAISKSVQADLRSSGFVVNERKSMWNPIQCLDRLDYLIDTVQFVLTVSDTLGE